MGLGMVTALDLGNGGGDGLSSRGGSSEKADGVGGSGSTTAMAAGVDGGGGGGGEFVDRGLGGGGGGDVFEVGDSAGVDWVSGGGGGGGLRGVTAAAAEALPADDVTSMRRTWYDAATPGEAGAIS